jgi:tetratricopeptide (TPR) repeat protein
MQAAPTAAALCVDCRAIRWMERLGSLWMSKKNNRKPQRSTTRKARPKSAPSKKRSSRTSGSADPERKKIRWGLVTAVLLAFVGVGWAISSFRNTFDWERKESAPPRIIPSSCIAPEILYPYDGTVFPADMAPPTFRFDDEDSASGWLVEVAFEEGGTPLKFEIDTLDWTPTSAEWETIKFRSFVPEGVLPLDDDFVPRAELVFRRREASNASKDSSSSDVVPEISFSTLRDDVGTPIFYREVNLPFSEAVLDPSAHIRWRFGSVSSLEQPPIVLDKMPVCGNCHSFSTDGAVLGMDVDYADDKGSYATCAVEEEMLLNADNIISWSAYKPEPDKRTFGLLSQVSPDGRYAISTVKDQSVFIAVPNLEFSQLFFPVQGILAFYNREADLFNALPGADDPDFVQSNPSWSPDGTEIVFARNEAYYVEGGQANSFGISKPEEVEVFLNGTESFQYDLYRIPFNEGQGGEAEPIPGASNNGMSNYFAKFSPDGRWIVFCRARNFMLLQPDSELYIIPAEGGEARRLECNTGRMNSWHSWSPNGKWLVFSSKANTLYTQLMLTHIDEQGRSSPPICLSRFTSDKMAANIPEFVNASSEAIVQIREEFVDDGKYVKIGEWSVNQGAFELAIEFLEKAVEINPQNGRAHTLMGMSLASLNRHEEASASLTKAVGIDPNDVAAWSCLGSSYRFTGDIEKGIEAYEKAIEIAPEDMTNYLLLGETLLDMERKEEGLALLIQATTLSSEEDDEGIAFERLGSVLLREGQVVEAVKAYEIALERQPDSPVIMIILATAHSNQDDSELYDIDEAIRLAEQACDLSDYRHPAYMISTAEIYYSAGKSDEAIRMAQRALAIAQAANQADLAAMIFDRLRQYEGGN